MKFSVDPTTIFSKIHSVALELTNSETWTDRQTDITLVVCVKVLCSR